MSTTRYEYNVDLTDSKGKVIGYRNLIALDSHDAIRQAFLLWERDTPDTHAEKAEANMAQYWDEAEERYTPQLYHSE